MQKWTVDPICDANGTYTIRVDDGSENGSTDVQPIATVYNKNVADQMVLDHNRNVPENNMLEPSNYSIFVLSDDQTWEQPTYRITKPISEHDFRMQAESNIGGFISFGVQEDNECPEEYLRTL